MEASYEGGQRPGRGCSAIDGWKVFPVRAVKACGGMDLKLQSFFNFTYG